MKKIISKLPPKVSEIFENCITSDISVNEITLRSDRDVVIRSKNRFITLNCKTSVDDITMCLQRLCNFSIYAYMDELKEGYITVEGGHRVGICGTAVLKDNCVSNIKNVNGLNIRIANEVIGCAEKLDFNIKNMLVISPPGCGKTTLMRDVCRKLGKKHKVSVVDERGEIASVHNGIFYFDMGNMTDVLSLCPKSEGIEMMLRSMSPEYIVTDEIASCDRECIMRALSYGVNIVATAHGNNIKDTLFRLNMKDNAKLFDQIVLLSDRNGPGTIEKIVKGEDAND